tara:strand:- start:545 stop:1747 length:1203 start_codon:yes stop_codon:yes gene_type:complete
MIGYFKNIYRNSVVALGIGLSLLTGCVTPKKSDEIKPFKQTHVVDFDGFAESIFSSYQKFPNKFKVEKDEDGTHIEAFVNKETVINKRIPPLATTRVWVYDKNGNLQLDDKDQLGYEVIIQFKDGTYGKIINSVLKNGIGFDLGEWDEDKGNFIPIKGIEDVKEFIELMIYSHQEFQRFLDPKFTGTLDALTLSIYEGAKKVEEITPRRICLLLKEDSAQPGNQLEKIELGNEGETIYAASLYRFSDTLFIDKEKGTIIPLALFYFDQTDLGNIGEGDELGLSLEFVIGEDVKKMIFGAHIQKEGYTLELRDGKRKTWQKFNGTQGEINLLLRYFFHYYTHRKTNDFDDLRKYKELEKNVIEIIKKNQIKPSEKKEEPPKRKNPPPSRKNLAERQGLALN